jgi:predicted nucleic acid-binding protein
MPAGDVFFDSNVPLYLIAAHPAKRDRAKAIIAERGVVSTQVLNEFAAVAFRKYHVAWPAIRDVLGAIKAICRVDPLTIEVHDRGVALAERYRFDIYDSLIIAAALNGGCTILYSEDMQHGQLIDGLTIINPFVGF